jgi:sulfotransferase family protein
VSFSGIKRRWPAVRHKAFVRGLSGFAPYYVINEFPKSGGTWLALMLSDALDLPFRRNAPIRLERAITHGHFLSPIGLHNVVVLWRDPRDILVSFYYHCYFLNEHSNAALVRLMKARCPFDDYTDVRNNLPTFIRFLSEAPVSPSFTWPQFAAIWTGRKGTVQTSYEALRADTPRELARIAEALTGVPLPTDRALEVSERHSFARAKQAADQVTPAHAEVSFVREGSLGGWRRYFTPHVDAALRDGGFEAPMRLLAYPFE